MSSNEIHKTRVINELRDFIKKLLQDPTILEQSLTIARRHAERGEQEMLAAVARDITEVTSVRIPEDPAEHSEADRLFLALLKEVISEEQALY